MGASDRRRKRRHQPRRTAPPALAGGGAAGDEGGTATRRDAGDVVATATRLAAARPRWILGAPEARALAEHLCSSAREKPVLVVSTLPEGRGRTAFDLDALAREAGQEVELYVIPNGTETYALAGALPPLTQVHGGAARLYPTDLSWMADCLRSRLYLARDEAEAGRSAADLMEDLGETAALRRLAATPPGTVAPRRVRGRVEGVIGPARALVRGEDGDVRTVVLENSFPGLDVPIGQVLVKGQEVSGVESVRGFLDLSGSVRDGAVWLGALADGCVVLVRVRSVLADRMVVEPWPGVRVEVGLADVTSSDLDRLTDLFWEGSVARARVHRTGRVDTAARGARAVGIPVPGGRLRLTLSDVDDDDPLEAAPSLLAGGPPWLDEGEAPWERADGRGTGDPGAASVGIEWVQAVLADDLHGTGPAPSATPAGLAAAVDPLEAARQRANRVAKELSVEREARVRLGRELVAVAQVLTAEQQARRLAEEEAVSLRNRVRELIEKNRRTRERVREPREPSGVGTRARPPAAPVFAEPEDQLRHEVYLAWCRRIPPTDKARRPLPARWGVGPGFLDSLEGLEGVARDKVLDVVVEVLTDLARDIPGREMHALRVDAGGGSAQRTRDDGATAWRVSLQVKSPGARRMHFWRLPDGTVELSRVGHHDDLNA